MRRKPLRPAPREVWGQWQDRSRTLKYHPLNRIAPQAPGSGERITTAYANLLFSVQVSTEPTAWGDVVHLWIKRHDGGPMTWKAMQRIKNELVGADRVAVEVYPAQADVVDTANMYHLWVLPKGFTLPFGLHVPTVQTQET